MPLPPIIDIPFLQRSTDAFFQGLPYVGPLWASLPVFDHQQPWTYVWGLLIPLGMLGGHLLRRKVKDDPTTAAVTVLGSVGVVNTGTMAVRRVESIAATHPHFLPGWGARGAARRTRDKAVAEGAPAGRSAYRFELLAGWRGRRRSPAGALPPSVAHRRGAPRS
jgi:hypothetical protein